MKIWSCSAVAMTGEGGAKGLVEDVGELHDGFEATVLATSASSKEAVDWLLSLRCDDSDDAVLGLLLPRLPRLEILDLQLWFECGTYLPRIFDRAARPTLPFETWGAFKHLHTVIVYGEVDEGEATGACPDIFASLFRLPSVRRLFCQCTRGKAPSRDVLCTGFLQQPVRYSSVTRLGIQDSMLQRRQLKAFLSMPKALTTFVHHTDIYAVDEASVDHTALRCALDQHQDTLETLWLGNMSCRCEIWEMEAERIEPLADFDEFSRLKRLGLGTVYLFGSHDEDGRVVNEGDITAGKYRWNSSWLRRLRGMWPPSLEVLVILAICPAEGAHLFHALTDLLRERPASLKRIRLEGRMGCVAHKHLASLVKFARACQSANIQLFLIDRGTDYKLLPQNCYFCESSDEFDERMWGTPKIDDIEKSMDECWDTSSSSRIFGLEELERTFAEASRLKDDTTRDEDARFLSA